MRSFKTNKIEHAVWIAAMINTYERFQLFSDQDAHKSLNDFYINTQSIVKHAYKFLETETGGLIFLNSFIGNRFESKYNYLSGDDKEVRLSKLNEFFGRRICPSIVETNHSLDTIHGRVFLQDLIEWYTFEYNELR